MHALQLHADPRAVLLACAMLAAIAVPWSTPSFPSLPGSIPPSDGPQPAGPRVPANSPLSGNGSITPNPLDIGVNAMFSGSASGGVSPYSFTWTFGDGGYSRGQVAYHAFARNGTYDARIWVTDAASGNWSGGFLVVVVPLPLAQIAIVPQTTDLHRTVVVTAVVGNGTAPYTYSYSGLPLGCPTQNRSSFLCGVGQVGTFAVTANVTDSSGRSGLAATTLTVHAEPSVTAFVAEPAAVVYGQTLQLSAGFTGGTGAIELRYSGLPSGCSSENNSLVRCSPVQAGTFHVTLSLSDAVGGINSSTLTVQVGPAPHSPGSPGPGGAAGLLGLPGLYGYAVVGALALLLGVGAGALLARRHRRSASGSVSGAPIGSDSNARNPGPPTYRR